jgi:hypothetical protein
LDVSPLEFMQRLAALVRGCAGPKLLERVSDLDFEHRPICGGGKGPMACTLRSRSS